MAHDPAIAFTKADLHDDDIDEEASYNRTIIKKPKPSIFAKVLQVCIFVAVLAGIAVASYFLYLHFVKNGGSKAKAPPSKAPTSPTTTPNATIKPVADASFDTLRVQTAKQPESVAGVENEPLPYSENPSGATPDEMLQLYHEYAATTGKLTADSVGKFLAEWDTGLDLAEVSVHVYFDYIRCNLPQVYLIILKYVVGEKGYESMASLDKAAKAALQKVLDEGKLKAEAIGAWLMHENLQNKDGPETDMSSMNSDSSGKGVAWPEITTKFDFTKYGPMTSVRKDYMHSTQSQQQDRYYDRSSQSQDRYYDRVDGGSSHLMPQQGHVGQPAHSSAFRTQDGGAGRDGGEPTHVGFQIHDGSARHDIVHQETSRMHSYNYDSHDGGWSQSSDAYGQGQGQDHHVRRDRFTIHDQPHYNQDGFGSQDQYAQDRYAQDRYAQDQYASQDQYPSNGPFHGGRRLTADEKEPRVPEFEGVTIRLVFHVMYYYCDGPSNSTATSDLHDGQIPVGQVQPGVKPVEGGPQPIETTKPGKVTTGGKYSCPGMAHRHADEAVEQLVADLNTTFGNDKVYPTQISFDIAKVIHHNYQFHTLKDKAAYEECGKDAKSVVEALALNWETSSYVNVYICGSALTGSEPPSVSQSSVGSHVSDRIQDNHIRISWDVVDPAQYNQVYANGVNVGALMLAKSLSHYFGLYPTYYAPYGSKGCQGTGDGVADTNPEDFTKATALIYYSTLTFCTAGAGDPPSTCSGTSDNVYNIAGWSPFYCHTHFTPLQVQVMQKSLVAYRNELYKCSVYSADGSCFM